MNGRTTEEVSQASERPFERRSFPSAYDTSVAWYALALASVPSHPLSSALQLLLWRTHVKQATVRRESLICGPPLWLCCNEQKGGGGGGGGISLN